MPNQLSISLVIAGKGGDLFPLDLFILHLILISVVTQSYKQCVTLNLLHIRCSLPFLHTKFKQGCFEVG